jgi:hypothetical protein
MVEERGRGVEAATQGLHLSEAAPPLQTWRLHMRRIETLVSFLCAYAEWRFISCLPLRMCRIEAYQLPSYKHLQNRDLYAAFLYACPE